MKHKIHIVKIGNVSIGGNHPVVIQSMTNTDTADVEATVAQVIELVDAGSEIVRMTISNEPSAKAVPAIKEQLYKKGYNVPLVGCFHYNGHKLLKEIPECASALDKFRLNPGNIGFGDRRDTQFEEFIEIAIKYDKPIRIGVNWGSLDQQLLSALMDNNSKLDAPLPSSKVIENALVMSALNSAKKAEDIGLPANKIIISCKTSEIPELISVYEQLALQSNYALHLGLTEAGSGIKGAISSAIGIGVLLQKGIGDTIRVSVTPTPGDSRALEVRICQEILQSLGLRAFKPQIISCPGCGRTNTKYFQTLVKHINSFVDQNIHKWRKLYPGIETLKIAVMGCVVNGPGESKHADIGLSLPGVGEELAAVVYTNGKRSHVLRGNNIEQQFENILKLYIENRFQHHKDTIVSN